MRAFVLRLSMLVLAGGIFTACGGGSETSAPATGTTPSVPVIVSFGASPSTITQGGSTSLTWSVTGATSLSIDQGVGNVGGSSVSVSPTTTTSYTLTATNASGSSVASTTVTVLPPQPATFAVSGTISGSVVAGVTVGLSGTASATTTTDASGTYSFTGLAPGSYLVLPARLGHVFSPASRSVTVVASNVADQNFVATVAPTHAISGTVSGPATSGVTITLGGAASAVTVTGAGGAYAFANLTDGIYSITPSLSGYAFTPSSASIGLSGADATQDFSSVGTNVITGTFSGLARAGIGVTLSGPVSATTTSDSSGRYTFTGLPNGAYTVTPSLPGGHVFSPASAGVTLAGVGVVQDFTVSGARSLSGTVSGLAVAGVTLTISGGVRGTATTDSSGRYAFTGLADGTYTVTPALPGGYVFTPASATVAISGISAVQDFSNTGAYSITGAVSGAATSGVTVALTGSRTATTVTGPGGTYAFTGLPSGAYTVSPSGAGLNFSPASASVTLGSGSIVQDFGNTVACAWTQASAYSLDATPAGAITRSGGLGGQGVAAVYGRNAWYQTSDWNLLFVPTGLAPTDDVFAVEADVYLLAAAAGSIRTADMEIFTTTTQLPGPNGTCQASGGLAALFGKNAPVLEWSSTATCAWTPLGSTSISPVTGQWRRFRLEGIRSSCLVRAFFDGVLVSTLDAGCSLNGPYLVLGSNAVGASNAAWSNLAIFRGNSPVCIPSSTHSISGTISGLAVSGVTVTLSGSATATTTTDSLGRYSFPALADGAYTVTPSLAGGYVFTPSAASVTLAGADLVQDFSSTGAYSISGTVSGASVSGITLTLSGARGATTTTNAVGSYAFSGLPNGSYVVTPSGASLTFTPSSAAVTIAGASVVRNFASAVACTWQQVASHALDSTPAGAILRDGAMGSQGPAAVYGRTAWYQTSDWNLLFVPTGLGPSDDVFAVEADLYLLPGTASFIRTADIEIFTTTTQLPGPNGTCQASGGVAALLGRTPPVFEWSSTGTCAWTLLSSVSAGPVTGQWHRYRVEGVRSTCTLRALLDGVLVRTWSGGCSLGGPYFVLSSNASGASNAAWSNMAVYKGNTTGCVP